MEKITLTPPLVEDLIFAMEDQGDKLTLDLESLGLSCLPPDGKNRIPLPKWTGREGFQLMNSFTSEINNPLAKHELQEILTGGTGVFKNFKNRLKQEQVLYRQWLHFKRTKLEDVLWLWAQEWQDRLVYTRVATPGRAEEIEEVFDMLLEDFSLRPGGGQDWELLKSLDRSALGVEAREGGWEDEGAWFEFRRRYVDYGTPGQSLLVAETPGGEWAGLCWGQKWTSKGLGEGVFEILLWWVTPEYRGLGLGKLVLQEMVQKVKKEWGGKVLFPIPQTSGLWKDFLKNHGWTQEAEVWVLESV